MTEVMIEQCPHCPHTVTGSLWWVGQQMPIHVHYAHPEHREANAAGGVWLDRIPYEPSPVSCVECGDPVLPLHAMCAVVEGKPITPLCRPCFKSLT